MHRIFLRGALVGRTPWSARDAPVPPSGRRIKSFHSSTGRPGGPPHNKCRIPRSGRLSDIGLKGCTTLKWNRRRDVGQAGSLRATQRVPRLPPLSVAIAAGGRLTIGRSLPSCPTGAPPAWRTPYAQMQALLLMNRVDVHFCVARPGSSLPHEFLACPAKLEIKAPRTVFMSPNEIAI